MLTYSTYGFYLVLLLLIDIMATIFRPEAYQDWIFFIVYFVLSIVLIVVNEFKKKKKIIQNFINYLLPVTYIILAYLSFILFIPALYGTMYKGLGNDAAYLIVYVFPLIDMIFYAMIIIITYVCDSKAVSFIKMLYFLNTGYAVGHLLLYSPD